MRHSTPVIMMPVTPIEPPRIIHEETCDDPVKSIASADDDCLESEVRHWLYKVDRKLDRVLEELRAGTRTARTSQRPNCRSSCSSVAQSHSASYLPIDSASFLSDLSRFSGESTSYLRKPMNDRVSQLLTTGKQKMEEKEMQSSASGYSLKRFSFTSNTIADGLQRLRLTTASHRASAGGRTAVKFRKVLEEPNSSYVAWIYGVFVQTLLVASAAYSLARSVDASTHGAGYAFAIEVTVDLFFMCEIIARFYLSPCRIAFFRRFFNMIDMVAVAPLAVRLTVFGFRGDRWSEYADDYAHLARFALFAIAPWLRLLKTLRRFTMFHLLLSAFKIAFEALPVLLYTLFIVVLFFASFIYLIERGNIDSLPRAVWFTFVTMSTVGYGDVTPQTPTGCVVVLALIVVGVLYMAIPIGIIGHAFTQAWMDRDRILLLQQVHDTMVEWGYEAKDIPALFQTFQPADGMVNIAEFQDMVREMNLGLSEWKILNLFKSIDVRQLGSVDAQDFLKAVFPTAHVEVNEAKQVANLRSTLEDLDRATHATENTIGSRIVPMNVPMHS